MKPRSGWERRALAVGALQGSGSARPGGCGSERFWIGGHLGRIGESVCIPAPSVVGLWLLLLSWMASEPRGNAEPPGLLGNNPTCAA